jgi:hypothetical protein
LERPHDSAGLKTPSFGDPRLPSALAFQPAFNDDGVPYSGPLVGHDDHRLESEVFSFVAGPGTTSATAPDLIGMRKRRSAMDQRDDGELHMLASGGIYASQKRGRLRRDAVG